MGHWQGTLEGLDVTPAFWEGKRVLVTGHTGFKGAWLCAWLHQLGAEVTGLALAPATTPNLWALMDLPLRSIIGDINDPAIVASAFEAANPEIVIHLAAQALVRHSYSDPAESFATNVVGTVNVLNTVRNSDARAVVCATSDKCYDNVEQIWGYRETDPMGGRDPYSASKGAAEIAIASMRHSFFAPYASGGHTARIGAVRAGNVIGGGDWAEDRLIPDIVRGCLGPQGAVTLRAPNSVRPWQHVLEPLRGYLSLAEALSNNVQRADSGWNFGPDREDERPVLGVAEALVAALGTGRIDIAENGADLHEARMLRLDCTKARVELGWVPLLSFSDCVAMTADWYGAWSRGENALKLCKSQIDSYQARLEART